MDGKIWVAIKHTYKLNQWDIKTTACLKEM